MRTNTAATPVTTQTSWLPAGAIVSSAGAVVSLDGAIVQQMYTL